MTSQRALDRHWSDLSPIGCGGVGVGNLEGGGTVGVRDGTEVSTIILL